MSHYYIISTFRKKLNFDDNFDNLLNEKLLLDENDIGCTIVGGSYKNKEYSLLINADFGVKKHIKRIMKKHFQECYLDITDSDAYLIDSNELVISHKTWLKVDRKTAINNRDFTWLPETDIFYIMEV